MAFEKKFTETLGTRVQIQKTDFGGKLTIDYFSEDDLSTLLRRIKEDASDTEEEVVRAVESLSANTPLAVTRQAAPVAAGIAVPKAPAEAAADIPHHLPEIQAAQVARVVENPPVDTSVPIPTTPPQAEPEPVPEDEQIATPVVEPPKPAPHVSPRNWGEESFEPKVANQVSGPIEPVDVPYPPATPHYAEPEIPSDDTESVGEGLAVPADEPVAESPESSVTQDAIPGTVPPAKEGVADVTTATAGQTPPTLQSTAPEPEDESDLYSIRNFSV
jgi:hypothetical protein